jgi:hypothetical protein
MIYHNQGKQANHYLKNWNSTVIHNISLMHISKELRLGLWCLTSLSTIFQLYRFIGGGNWSTRRKPPTWQTLSHNVVSSN